jgi:riboflavin kinase/FMN adenylyltransferase
LETFYHATLGLLKRSAIALGFFDGVHPGHQAVIGAAVAEAKKQNLVAAVVTFRDHPRSLTQGSSPLLLTVIEQRLAQFEKLGVEAALVLDFTEELCRLAPEEYVRKILHESMGAKLISVGYNHHFGRDREGSPQLLAELGTKMGFSVRVAPPVFVDGQEVSSSRIREALFKGEIESANHLLSRPYAVMGTVVRGAARGRSIDVPTANLATEEYQVIPARGVYVGLAHIKGREPLPAVINIGTRPTFDADKGDPVQRPDVAKFLVEAHILNFNQDIYDQKLELSFYQYLREEKKFDSVALLKTQILADCQKAKEFFQVQTNTQPKSPTAEPEHKLPA